ncbi:3-phosphoshikimate 1-carboxyvinyltransferase [Paenisporosarcina sp. HGH0030]|uniref:3-phosphoshikimate 1-carboxyvinyltransferase n=1 Tax=Paenisporosarcina sp. HGH0030 TaxID=1078085 RepID=UPI00034E8300|nr:3-phosphoshikimate 1-carboxyvinyltransferase [Paenisporosarcina sp. HGH0030]EPD53168.1 3-phosphoshikimate 1-carboxyvinyltransferase [Paenisporosarcina sp. HGH0030]
MKDSIKLQAEQVALRGTVRVPGDKSISHRSIMFGAMAKGKTTVNGFLLGDDCLSTISCFQKLGVDIQVNGNQVTITSDGMESWKEPSEILDTGNSGTTTRLMLGILAGSNVHSVLVGDESIAKRPMKRVIEPLRQMGAQISGRSGGQFTPLAIQGTELTAIDYTMPVASAQVKSAILLAGLQANGVTTVRESEVSRDHTERMLRQFGADITCQDGVIQLQGGQKLSATHIEVPGDISSAAFFLVAGAIAKDSSIHLEHVGLNPTRTGILDVLQQMGAKLDVELENGGDEEPIGRLSIQSSQLKGIEIGGELIPRLIDEIPIIALLATQAQGTTVIKDAEELKVKETDRITAVVDELKKLGADIEATEDGMVINGPVTLTGGVLQSYGDHRIGMMGAIASVISTGPIEIEHASCISVSYPNFFDHLRNVSTCETLR